jgi:SAM-dependent methyltransferase
MRSTLLEFIVCPECHSRLTVKSDGLPGSVVEHGSLTCSTGHAFPIVRGVPDFVGGALEPEVQSTASSFGDQWQRFREDHAAHRQQFLDWIAPVGPEDFAGKVTLELGCGMGRHAALAGRFGATAHVAVDVGDAVFVAAELTADQPNVHVIRADLFKLPLRNIADLVFSVGVLHHTPDPRRAFAALLGCAKPGGRFAAWVYGREGNGWIVHVVTPIRRVTSRLPGAVLYRLSQTVAWAALIPLVKIVYGPLDRLAPATARSLPYGHYLTYVSSFSPRQLHGIVHDHLGAPVAHYLKREDLLEIMAASPVEDVVLRHHNGMSWLVTGRVRDQAGAGPERPGRRSSSSQR